MLPLDAGDLKLVGVWWWVYGLQLASCLHLLMITTKLLKLHDSKVAACAPIVDLNTMAACFTPMHFRIIDLNLRIHVHGLSATP